MKKIREMNEPYKGEDIAIFIPTDVSVQHLIIFDEGTGDNLLPEDIKAGYKDYVNWEIYTMHIDCDGAPEVVMEGIDGGMAMFKDYVRDLTLASVAKAVLREACIQDDQQAYLWEVSQ